MIPALLGILSVPLVIWLLKSQHRQLVFLAIAIPFDGIKYGSRQLELTFSVRKTFEADVVQQTNSILSLMSLGNIAIIIALLGLMLAPRWKRSLALKRFEPLLVPCIASIACIIIGVATSQDFGFSLRRAITLGGMYATMFIVVALVDSRQSMDSVLKALIIGGILSSLWALAQGLVFICFGLQFGALELFVGKKLLFFPRVNGPFVDPTYLGVYVTTCLFLLYGYKPPSGILSNMVVRTVCYSLLGFVLLVSFSRSVWLGVAIGGVALHSLSLKAARRQTARAVIPLLVVLTTMVLATTQIDRLIKLSPTTVSYRMKLYKEAQDLFLKAPVFGHGIGSDLLLMSKNTHNTYLSLLVTQGLIGLLTFASIVLTVISCGFRNRCFRDAILFDINSSLLSALLATTVAAVTYDLLALKVLWVLFGLIVTCSCFAESRSSAMVVPAHVT